jgi:hypothetical protein
LGIDLGSTVALSAALGLGVGILTRYQSHAAGGGCPTEKAEDATPRRNGSQVPCDRIE